MAFFIMNSVQHETGCSPSPVLAIERAAFYFQSNGRPLFAWLHRQQQNLDHGVIVCPPLGYEQIHAHRSLRHLADALARAGLNVLRFDYDGTGDSSGSDEDSDRYATWLTNIRDAKRWMEQELGCSQISLFGLRLGASFALQVATEQAVENLVLWAPVVKGRQYVREMKMLSLTAETASQALSGSPGDIEAAGFVHTKQTADDLSRIDLLQCRPQCQRALIMGRDDLPADTRLREHFFAQGIDATQTGMTGYAEMMAEPHDTKVPNQAIARTVEWLIGSMPESSPTINKARREGAAKVDAKIQFQQHASSPVDSESTVVERILPISETPNLFGVFCNPEGGLEIDRPVVLLVNGGSAYHVGPNRLYVSLARQLAAHGFGSLRLDLCGLGDSITDDEKTENNPFTATGVRDIEIALKYLQEQFDVKRVVLMGLCSGAYMAFQAAMRLPNPILVDSVLINPRTFYWKEGSPLGVGRQQDRMRFHYYMKAAMEPRKWLKMLAGGTKTGLVGAARILMQHWRTGAQNRLAQPLTEDLSADLDRVAKTGRRLTCLFSRSEPGYDLLMYHARRKVDELCRSDRLKLLFVENADHTFSQRIPRQLAVQTIAEYLRGRYSLGYR